MYREFFQRSPLLAFPLAALVLFVVVFALVVWRAFARNASQFDSVARLPLDDGEVQS